MKIKILRIVINAILTFIISMILFYIVFITATFISKFMFI